MSNFTREELQKYQIECDSLLNMVNKHILKNIDRIMVSMSMGKDVLSWTVTPIRGEFSILNSAGNTEEVFGFNESLINFYTDEYQTVVEFIFIQRSTDIVGLSEIDVIKQTVKSFTFNHNTPDYHPATAKFRKFLSEQLAYANR